MWFCVNCPLNNVPDNFSNFARYIKKNKNLWYGGEKTCIIAPVVLTNYIPSTVWKFIGDIVKCTIYLLRGKFGEIPHKNKTVEQNTQKFDFFTEMPHKLHLQHLWRKHLHWCVNYPYLVWSEKKEIQKAYSLICMASEYKKATNLVSLSLNLWYNGPNSFQVLKLRKLL